MVQVDIKFEDLLEQLQQLKDIEVELNNDNKRELHRKRSNVFGGSGWRSGGLR